MRILLLAIITSFSSQAQYVKSNIDGDFEGWEGETIFKLMNGQIWQQSSYDYMYTYSFMPEVKIFKTSSGYRMEVEDVKETISVIKIDDYIESNIDGDFEGWEGETIFKLMNGQIWQQSSYDYMYTYSFMPKVIIINTLTGYKMMVDGTSKTINVKLLKDKN